MFLFLRSVFFKVNFLNVKVECNTVFSHLFDSYLPQMLLLLKVKTVDVCCVLYVSVPAKSATKNCGPKRNCSLEGISNK